MNERELFIAVLQRTDPAERVAYLERTFAGNTAVRQRIELLLKAEREVDEILQERAPADTDTATTEPEWSAPLPETETDPCDDPSSTFPSVGGPDEPPLPATDVATSLGFGSTLSFVSDPAAASARLPGSAATDGSERAPVNGADPGDGHAAAEAQRRAAADAPRDNERTLDLHPGLPSFASELSGLFEFDLLAELGRGGMGVVYKARHRPLNRIVALKMVREGNRGHFEYRARFRIEAEAVARLRHPNIIQVYHLGEADDCLFVTLELLEGGSLADRLKGTTQPGRAAAALVETLAKAMHAAHQAGIVHRDLKPSNVLFDRDGTPKISDFGLAKRLEIDEGETQTGQIMGTPSYMAPEQAQGDVRTIGPQADIYALGAILYEALTGRPPFKGPNAVSTLRQVIYDDVVPPTRIEPRIARDLETICLKCLQKEPAKRYGTALELAEDLRRYLDNCPVRARRTPLWERSAKWALRHPAAATVLALALVAALVQTVLALHHDAQHRATVLDNLRKLEQQRVASEQRLDRGQALLLRNDYDEGRDILRDLVADLKNVTGLNEIRVRAQHMLEQSNQKALDDAERRRAEERQRNFVRYRNQAFFHETPYTALDRQANLRATRAAASAALAVFATPGPDDEWIFAPLPRALLPQEQAEIRDGCYALLLVLAEALAEPLSGEDPAAQAGRGLRLLNRAAALRAQPTRAWHRALAGCLAKKGDEAGAARARAAAERLRPTTVLDHYLAGREAYKLHDSRTARAELETVLRMQPGHFWALCLSAGVALQTNQPGTAQLALFACIEQQPQLPELHILRGVASHQAAVQLRRENKAQTIEDGSTEADEVLQFEAAESDFHKALELLGEGSSDALRYTVMVDRAMMRFQRGRLDEAIADLEEAIRIDGGQYHAYASLAQVFQAQKKWDEAAARFTQAIRVQPGFAALYRGRAAVALERDDQAPAHRAAALSDLEAAIRHEQPGNPVLAGDHFQRAELLHRNGRLEEALAACDAALKVAPDLDTAHRLRVEVLLDLGRTDEVIRSCDGALAHGKTWPDMYGFRGLARAKRGDYLGAVDDYTQALALRPGQPRLLIARGLAYVVCDAPKPALKDFDEALRLDAASGEAHGGRGLALALLGDYRTATDEADESLHRDPPTARRAYNAARIYALAAAAARADESTPVRLAASLAERYQDRAVALVQRALELTPAARRAAFWQGQVAPDPALRSLQRRLRSIQPPGAVNSPAPGPQ